MPDTTPRVRRTSLAAKEEATYRTNAFGGAPVAADILPAEDIEVEEPRGFYPTPTLTGLLDHMPGTPGELLVRCRGAIRLRGKGVAYDDTPVVVPEADLLFQICGASRTIDSTPGAEKVTYKWFKGSTPEHKSASLIYMQEIGASAISVTALGVRGTGSFVLVAGQPVLFRYELVGVHGGRGTQALVTGLPSTTPTHPILAAAAFQVGSENFAAQFRALTISLNTLVVPRMSPNDANAYDGVFLTTDPSRPPSMDFDPELVAAATFDWFTKHGAGTVMDWSFNTNGTVGGYRRVKFGEAGNKAQIASLRWGQRDELRTSPVTLNLLANTGQDALVIEFDKD